MSLNSVELERELSMNQPARVTPLRYAHVFKAARTFVDAFANDPVMRYDHKPSPGQKPFERAFLAVLITLWIRRKISLTIKNGAAFIIAAPAKQLSGPRGPADRFYDRLTAYFFRALAKLDSAEGRKRNQEVQTKVNDVVSKTLGDRVDQMMYIDVLATEPLSQGRGYGGALLKAVITVAELTSEAIWLQCSNINNIGFYNSHGFVTVGEVVVGDTNPTWHEPPVVISIMVRELRSSNSMDEKLA